MRASGLRHDDIALGGIAERRDGGRRLPAGFLEKPGELLGVEEVEGPRLLELDQGLGVVEEGPDRLEDDFPRLVRPERVGRGGSTRS
jgi:hypothetical protein